MPLFTIIIPTYNSADTLEATLASIAEQQTADVSVCVMDGGSTDTTEAIVQKWKQEVAALQWFQETDHGIYDAMNKGMRKATGKWILFLGSDDTLHHHSVLQPLFEILRYTDADVVYGNAKIIGNTGWAKDGDLYDGPFTLEKLLQQNICHQAMCYRTSFVREEIGDFNQRYVKSADWDFNLRCWAKGRFEYIDLVIANFAAGGVSTETTDHPLIEDFVPNVQQYFGWKLSHPLLQKKGTWYYPHVRRLQQENRSVLQKLITFTRRILRKLKKTVS
ncbi:glycosyltransferase [Flavobacteriaceae bacterium TK19130]|nr:glycosyltransferase [Thermobacterium salinum]